jgi:hypothetical protein
MGKRWVRDPVTKSARYFGYKIPYWLQNSNNSDLKLETSVSTKDRFLRFFKYESAGEICHIINYQKTKLAFADQTE